MLYWTKRLGIIKEVKVIANHNCVICQQPMEYQEQVKMLYMEYLDHEFIAESIGLDIENVVMVEQHAKAFTWNILRSKNPFLFYSALIREKGPEFLKLDVSQLGIKGVIAAAVAVDKLVKENMPAENNEKEVISIGRTMKKFLDSTPVPAGVDADTYRMSVKQLALAQLESTYTGITQVVEAQLNE